MIIPTPTIASTGSVSFANLSATSLTNQTAGNPCVGIAGETTPPCTGLITPETGDTGYTTAIVMMPLAASGALNRVNTEVNPAAAAIRLPVAGTLREEML